MKRVCLIYFSYHGCVEFTVFSAGNSDLPAKHVSCRSSYRLFSIFTILLTSLDQLSDKTLNFIAKVLNWAQNFTLPLLLNPKGRK